MPITPLPSAPSRQDPANFANQADAFLGALPTFATEANALQADVNSKQVSAANSATAAAASELAANAASNASVWVSGTTYSIGNVRYSPITFLSYRRKTAGAGTTDPSADSTNWQVLSGQGNVTLTDVQTISNKTITNSTITTSSIAGSQITGNISGNAANVTGTVAIANGGTGATTAANAFNAIKQAATESATGVVELATTAEAQAGTDTVRAITPATLKSAQIQLGTAVSSTSGTAINFTGIPSWAKRVTVVFRGLSTTGTSEVIVRLGAGAIQTTGYASSCSRAQVSGITTVHSSTGMLSINPSSATEAPSGQYIFTLVGENAWVGQFQGSGGTHHHWGAGGVTLSGTLDSVTITTVGGTNTFDAGTINISWE